MSEKEKYEVDPDLLAEFIDESLDSISDIDNYFVKLEEEPENLDYINRIFRPVHSIKGNSVFFGLMQVKKIAHTMEDLLDLLRKKQLKVGKKNISVLLKGVDLLKSMMQRARNNQPEIDNEKELHDIISLIKNAQSSKSVDCKTLGKELLNKMEMLYDSLIDGGYQQYSVNVSEMISVVNNMLSGIKDNDDQSENKQNTEWIDSLYLLLKKEKKDKISDEFKNIVENLLKDSYDQNTKNIIEKLDDDFYSVYNVMGWDPILEKIISDAANELKEKGKFKESEDKLQSIEKTEQKNKSSFVEHKKSQSKTMRVPEETIDKFLSYVGELVVVGEMFEHLQKKISSLETCYDISIDFKRTNESFETLSKNLQKSIMEIRKVPLKIILQKVPRMVRDIASSNNKKIKVNIIGEQIEVDKSLIDNLEAPLTHMVRNSADHGIEDPETRKNKGKPEEGMLNVDVKIDKENVVMKIEDDGKGLDVDAIKEKAINMGLIGKDHELTQKDIIDLIFSSGLSTAKKVTDVSGRGVGLDVVKKNIENAGGKIEIKTQKDKGTSFFVILPESVTTQIIDGFVVISDSEYYVIPLECVQETFRPNYGDVNTISGKGEFVKRRDEIIPTVVLKNLFGKNIDLKSHINEMIVVTVKSKGMTVAICVDDLAGVQQVVLKDIKGLDINNKLFVGGAVMGDGKIAMIIDMDKIFN